MLRKWEQLPEFMKCEEVKNYYIILDHRKRSLLLKRAFDIMDAIIIVILVGIPRLLIAVWIKIDQKGPVLCRQEGGTA